MPGRHRPYGRASRPQRLLLSMVGVLALIGLTVVTVRTVTAQAEGCGSTGSIQLTVAAAPAIAGAVQDAAAAWQKTSPQVTGGCIRVSVSAVPPAQVATAFAVRNGGTLDTGNPSPAPSASQPRSSLPDVWIPDSVSWINRVTALNQDLFEDTTPDVAMSPVVAGMPATAARALTGGLSSPLKLSALGSALKVLLSGGKSNLRLAVSEPRSDATGLSAATVLKNIVVAGPADLPALIAVDRSVGAARAPDSATLASGFTGSNPPTLVPMSEQQVLAYDNAHSGADLLAVPFDPAAPALDYPYAAVASLPRTVSQAADAFRDALAGTTYRTIFAKYGFRAPDGSTVEGFPAEHGATAGKISAPLLNDSNDVSRVIGVWASAITPSRLLALADLTSSMSLPIAPGGASRLDVLRGAALQGLRLFTNDSQIGLWGFAAGLSGNQDFVPAVGVAPLADPQRQALDVALNRMAVLPTPNRGLFETILAAYKVMRDGYLPTMSNTVVVFTDGTEDKAGGMTIQQAMNQLQELIDITRPVRIVALGIGPNVNMNDLSQMAQATGGKVFHVDNPSQIQQIFLQALLKVDWPS